MPKEKQSILERLFEAADNHADDAGEFDHAVGDLQDLLASAWGLMTLEQRKAFLKGNAVENLIEAGAREEFTQRTLLAQLKREATTAT